MQLSGFFKFHLIVGVEESIVNALYRLRITDQLFKILRFIRVVRSQSTHQRPLRHEIKKKNTRYNDTMFSKFNNQNIVYVLLHEQVKKVFI
jgi:ribonuclease HIII